MENEMVKEEKAMAQTTDPEVDSDSNSMFRNSRSRCCCFPSFGSHHGSSTDEFAWWQRLKTEREEDQWLTRGINAFKRMREWSEIVAGPKWKTFIRSFSKNRGGGGGGNRHGRYNYDPLSYALNFDDGPGQSGDLNDVDDFSLYRNFSARYAAVPRSGKVPVAVAVAVETTASSGSTLEVVRGNDEAVRA